MILLLIEAYGFQWQNLGMIESRLEKLDEEKEELSQYYALDKERR